MTISTSLPVQPHLYIGDGTGRPLDNGMVYFGQPDKDPEFYPINIYHDANKTVLAAQPVRTKQGFMNANGDMTEVYASEIVYSVKVVDAHGVLVFYKPRLERINISEDAEVSTILPSPDAVIRTQRAKNTEFVTVKDFGAVGDGVADDTIAINNAMKYAAANKVRLRVTGGDYKIMGYILTHSNLHMVFDNNAWIIPHAWSRTGAILTNVSANPALREQHDVTIENPQMDGQHLPYHDTTSNDNAIGFGLGMTRARIVGGYIRNFKYNFTSSGAGGKAINFEAGTFDSCTEGTLIAENCSVGIFVQGGSRGGTSRIQLGNILAKNCESAFIALGIDVINDPDGSPLRQSVSVGNIMAYNCGHTPARPVNGYQPQKSGIVVFGEAQNVYIDSINAFNDDNYPLDSDYPTVESGQVGGGLSGPIGAVIWGWGRNINIGSVTYHGKSDYLIYYGRARAVGEDSAPTTYPVNSFNFNIDQFNHIGKAQYIFHVQSNVPNGAITGTVRNIEIDDVDFIATAQLSRHVDIFANIVLKNGKSMNGRVATLLERNNNLKTYASKADRAMNYTVAADGYYSNMLETVANDGRFFLTPPKLQGLCIVSSSNSFLTFMFSYRISESPQITIIGTPPPQVAALPQALTGTTGVAGNFTVGCNSATLYFENRRGGPVTFNVTFVG